MELTHAERKTLLEAPRTERPENCMCSGAATEGIPCWPCANAGFLVPNPNASSAEPEAAMTDGGASACDCPMDGSSDGSLDRCNEENTTGLMCSKPAGHDGPHAACSVVEHPKEVWD